MNAWREAAAPAKLNLALIVGPLRDDGKHEVVTVLERLSLADTIAVRRAPAMRVTGFADDTLVHRALETLTGATHGTAAFEARVEKRIPVAAGLGGGSSDAAAALMLANGLLDEPLSRHSLHELAAGLGSDVPFFLRAGPQLATGYAGFDERRGEIDFDDRRTVLLDALERSERPADLARLPANDLAASPLATDLLALGAFRADVTGAGPVVYGLFADASDAASAAAALGDRAETWCARPT